jgi:hypothetical protein
MRACVVRACVRVCVCVRVGRSDHRPTKGNSCSFPDWVFFRMKIF